MRTYGVAICKGGQGKSTTVSTVARLCALYGARVLVVDLAQPGTTTASLRDIWPDGEHGDLSTAMLAFRTYPAGVAPEPEQVQEAFATFRLPVRLTSQPSWSGGQLLVLPWDETQGEAAAYLHSELTLRGLITGLGDQIDLALIDFPAENGSLFTNALAATDALLMPLTPETPALEGAAALLRQLARARAGGHDIALHGVLLTRCEPKSKRLADIAQTLMQAEEVEGEQLSRKLLPFAIRANEFYEQAFRYGVPIWERSADPANWAAYVLLAEELLRDAGLARLAERRGGPALLPANTRILDTTALFLADPELPLADFERAHAYTRVANS